ncbi:hypothetical protein F362_gp75 [Enterobacter phage EcP1]|uniref:Uncharacterized protein n=1 Tax=Enterobacter phage EcP1 TaxID=942016 RepID=E9NIK0_9CAUD|nr:hypothetical protein F362_gp75 [Enterobacter phage EcP1]ADU79226.1 hypothetical protein EcP1_gp75 [Enterobacter phage EcP1]
MFNNFFTGIAVINGTALVIYFLICVLANTKTHMSRVLLYIVIYTLVFATLAAWSKGILV